MFFSGVPFFNKIERITMQRPRLVPHELLAFIWAHTIS